MSMPTIHKPQTVGELRAALAELPDDMPVFSSVHRSDIYLNQLRVFEVRASKAKPKKVVYRGGDPALVIE